MGVIDDYIAAQPESHRPHLLELYALIRDVVPDATEKLSYGMPTFHLNGNLVHFAVATNHVGLYPAPEGVAAFVGELDTLGLRHSKGAIQFPLVRPIPRELVTRIVEFRAAQNRAKGG